MRPYWTGTLGREVEKYLKKITLPPILNPAAVVLDLGCGPGSNLFHMLRLGLPFGHYVGFDLSPAMLRARRTYGSAVGDFVQGDAHYLPFTDESFDVIISTWMFSHLPEPIRVVHEAQRLLQPNDNNANQMTNVVLQMSRAKRLIPEHVIWRMTKKSNSAKM